MLLIFGILIATGYAILAGGIFLLQPHLIYYPETGQNGIDAPDSVGLAYETVELKTADGENLHGWFVPAPEATATVLFFHGNAGNISNRLEYLLMFHRLGYNTFIIDYRGYGQSSGEPSEKGTYRDAEAAWQYLTEQKDTPPSRIVLFGESLGGAVASWLAAREKPAVLVLASAFTSVPDMAAKIYPFLPVRLLSLFEYSTEDHLGAVTCPVFVAHSPKDEIVPFAHSKVLYNAAPEPKQFLELQGGHNTGLIFMREEWVNALDEFIRANL